MPSPDEIDDRIDAWHREAHGVPLRGALGLDEAEYERFVGDAATFPDRALPPWPPVAAAKGAARGLGDCRLDPESIEGAVLRAAAAVEAAWEGGNAFPPASGKSVLGPDGRIRDGLALAAPDRLDPSGIEEAFRAYARGAIDIARARECALLWARGIAFDPPPAEAD